MIKFFKFKEKLSERLPDFFESGEQSTTVEIYCNSDNVWKEHIIESKISSHHYTRYNCHCGETLKLAVIDYAYLSDRVCLDKNHIVVSKTGFKKVLDYIYNDWMPLG